jgi:hypothetical protein
MMSVGSGPAAQFPDQHVVPGTRIPTLSEVLALVRKSGDRHVRLNIETKIDPNHPEQSPEPQRFVTLLLDLLQVEKFSDRVMIQSFDWRTLQLVQKLAPRDTHGLSHGAKRIRSHDLAGQGFGVDGGFQSCRARPFSSANDQGGRWRDLVAVLRRCRCRADIPVPSPRPFSRGLDRQQARGYGAHDRNRRRRNYLGSSGPVAASSRRGGHYPAGRFAGHALSSVIPAKPVNPQRRP